MGLDNNRAVMEQRNASVTFIMWFWGLKFPLIWVIISRTCKLLPNQFISLFSWLKRGGKKQKKKTSRHWFDQLLPHNLTSNLTNLFWGSTIKCDFSLPKAALQLQLGSLPIGRSLPSVAEVLRAKWYHVNRVWALTGIKIGRSKVYFLLVLRLGGEKMAI